MIKAASVWCRALKIGVLVQAMQPKNRIQAYDESGWEIPPMCISSPTRRLKEEPNFVSMC